MGDLFLGDVGERYDFDPPFALVLSGGDGDEYVVLLDRFDVGEQLVAYGELDVAEVARAVDGGRFGLDWVEFLPDWDDELAVSVVLELDRSVATGYDSSDALVVAMARDTDAPTRAASAWTLLEAVQTVTVPDQPNATLQVGLQRP